MKSLIFLLIVAFVSSQIIRKGLIDRINYCKGGKLQDGRCVCPNNTALFNNECKQCVGGSIMSGRCKCPKGKFLKGNECILLKVCSEGYIRLYNNTCIKKCPKNQIRVGNECRKCPPLSIKIESRNICDRLYIISDPIRDPIRVHKKPVIYLYPKETMDISVQLNLKNSKFTTIYPKFNDDNTWNVRAKPNGDILMNGKTYPYLFWEAESYNSQNTNEGFVVSEENAEEFLEEKLNILGLNEKEKTDFITFWLPVLLKNKLSLCSFQTEKFFENMELNVTPKPDSMIRIFLSIKKLEAPINVKEQKLVSVERKGYTVVEWGGSNF
jgi:hypothetical protein